MLTIVKIGGNIIDDASKLDSFLTQFAQVSMPKILVHGGGKLATEVGKQLGIEPNYIEGRRVTDKATLELVTMVYGGLINKTITAALQKKDCNAIGLTGADGNLIKAEKRPVKTIDYGYVGDVADAGVNTTMLQIVLDNGLTPVLAPLTHDGEGNMLNTNADTIAQIIAIALAPLIPVQLIYCFEKNGVLKDPDDDDSVIDQIGNTEYEQLIQQGIINGGMIPKITNACNAVKTGVSKVIIGNADNLSEMINGKSGTVII